MIKKGEEKIKTNLREGNISIILDSYDDIFSDFDPREYSEKALSDDFLIECKKASKDKKSGAGLRFFAPKEKRNLKHEQMIKRRLREHFQKHFKEKELEIKRIKREGFVWFILGAVIMIGGTFLYPVRDRGFLYTLAFIMSEPASWFFFWEGLGKIFITSKRELPDYEFYKKMSRVPIDFHDY